MLRVFFILRWVFLAIALFFFCFWVLYLSGVIRGVDMGVTAKIESYKYLAGELLMMMFFWIAFLGRGYCHYCPLGTVLGLLAKPAGQKISTNMTTCVKCGKCTDACTMAIDVKSGAVKGADVRDLKCVGCGHCVDACPTRNLRYSTRFLGALSKTRVAQTKK